MANELVIRISGDVKNYEEALKKAQDGTHEFSDLMAGIAQKATIAFAALTAEIGFAAHAYANSEQQVIKLTGALQNNGIASDELLNSYKEQAEAIEKLTGIDGDLVIKGQAVLQNFIGQSKITPQLTAAIADLSARTGKDLSESFEIVGRAIQGKTRGLEQLGIQVDSTKGKEELLADITTKLSAKFGGSAEAAAQGLGSFKLLEAQFDNIQKKIGEQVAPALTKVFQGLAKIFEYIAEHDELVKFATAAVVAGAAVTGLIAAVSAGAAAFVAIKAALAAFEVQASVTTLAVRGLVGATGLGLIVLVAAEIYQHWGTIWPRMQAIFTAFTTNMTALLGGFGSVLKGVFTLNPEEIKEGLAKVKETLKKGFAEASKELELKPTLVQDPKALEASKALNKVAEDNERARIEQTKLTNQALALEAENGSKELIDIKRKEADLLNQFQQSHNDKERELLKVQIANLKELELEANADALEQQDVLNNTILAKDEEFQALRSDQQKIFLLKNKQALQASILSETQAENQVALEKAKIRIKSNNEFLVNQVKFGKAYAEIYRAQQSEEVQAADRITGNLVGLANSKNSTLKGIGKAAAVAQIAIKTAQGALAAFADSVVLFGPIAGPAIGTALAAAIIAYGAEQTGNVIGAAQGGLLSGGIPGVDSIPVLAQQGELIAPKKNFDEVVNAVADKRAGIVQQSEGSSLTEVVLTLKGDLVKFVETEIIKRQRLGISTFNAALT